MEWNYLSSTPRTRKNLEIHDQAMRAVSAAQIQAVLGAFDFAQAGTLVDVGGGTGELLAAIGDRDNMQIAP